MRQYIFICFGNVNIQYVSHANKAILNELRGDYRQFFPPWTVQSMAPSPSVSDSYP